LRKYKKNNTKFVGALAEKAFQFYAMLNGILTCSPDDGMGRYDSITDCNGNTYKTQIKCCTRAKDTKNGASYTVNTSSVDYNRKSYAYSPEFVDFITLVVLPDENFVEPQFYHIPIGELDGRKSLSLAPARNGGSKKGKTMEWIEQFRNNWEVFKTATLKKAA